MSNKNERIDEMQEYITNKKEAIMKKLSDVELRRNQAIEKRSSNYKKLLNKEEHNYENLLKNQSKLTKQKQELNKFVLEYQSDRINRANLKEHSVGLNRLNAQ